jgi:prolyl-tRNA editing enzyme YbaK/EbsC (Cys-tRNA(Pro) deacylase)
MAADGEELTGFRRNGLSPFGSALACPVLLDAEMEARLPASDKSVWLGGGEYDVKINVLWDALVGAVRPVLISLSGVERPKQ